MASENRSEQQAQDAKVILGIQKNLLSVPTLILAGQAITPADLVKLVQSCIDSGNAIAPAKVKWTAAVQAYRVLNKQVAPILRALRAYLINTYGPTSTVLADFGFSPHQDGGEDARSEGPGRQEVRGHPQGPETRLARSREEHHGRDGHTRRPRDVFDCVRAGGSDRAGHAAQLIEV